MQHAAPPVAPTCFVPSGRADFVGQSGKVAEVLLREAGRLRANSNQPFKLQMLWQNDHDGTDHDGTCRVLQGQ